MLFSRLGLDMIALLTININNFIVMWGRVHYTRKGGVCRMYIGVCIHTHTHTHTHTLISVFKKTIKPHVQGGGVAQYWGAYLILAN